MMDTQWEREILGKINGKQSRQRLKLKEGYQKRKPMLDFKQWNVMPERRMLPSYAEWMRKQEWQKEEFLRD